MHRVEALFDPAARFLHRRIVGVGRNPDGSPTTIAPRLNGSPRLARSQDLKSMRRLTTTAMGGSAVRKFAPSVTMPKPATRAALATSAVIATEAPSASSRMRSRKAGAPPLRRWSRPGRPPEPRTGVTPSRRRADAWRRHRRCARSRRRRARSSSATRTRSSDAGRATSRRSRGFAAERGVQIGGLGREAGRALNEPQIGGEQKADRFLPNGLLPRRSTSFGQAGLRSRPVGSRKRCR